MDELYLEKINFKFEGNSNPTTDELIEVLQSIKDIIPRESRETFHINKIEEGSIDIIALVEPVMDFFTNTDINFYWDIFSKVQMVATGVGASVTLANWIRNKITKAKINMTELNELLTILNNDPNSIRIITHNDFKNFRKLSKVLQKRKSGIIIKRESNNQTIELKNEDTKIIDLIANASGEEVATSIENRILHLNITRVSFTGKEQWKAKILEYADNSLKYISIEDENLLLLINGNQIYFSGKEVIEAMIRIETINGVSKYYLIEYRDIINMNNIQYGI